MQTTLGTSQHLTRPDSGTQMIGVPSIFLLDIDTRQVCRRERSSIAEKLMSAYERRNEVVGSSARERVESEIIHLSGRDEELQQRITDLESREDEVYKKWRSEYHELRYRTPSVTRLFQATFRVASDPIAEVPITADPKAMSRPAPEARAK